MQKLLFVLLTVSILAVTGTAFANHLYDDFSKADFPERQALRGEWTYENNEAHCVSDPELYKKFKNHGPILRYDSEFSDGTIEFEFQPKDVERMIFTLNSADAGHVFRMRLADGKTRQGSRIYGWAGPSKDNDPEMIAVQGVPTLDTMNGKWVRVKIVIEGDRATVTIGDYSEELKHASIGREKGEVTISFASGELGVRGVHIHPAK
ncbi:Hypothetical protein PBC10988_18710 [Planctomycetales bacterium 10988]|nr:Hypothetical protein PBC10988_18710 [Planctomycetales bacterium 10988]